MESKQFGRSVPLLFTLSLLAAALILASVTLVYAAPAITLSQSSGTVGTRVTVYGTGFSPNSTVGIFWDEWGNLLNVSETDGTGAFTADFAVPEAVNGEHTVLARDPMDNTASATFRVVASITLTPDHGTVGSTFSVVGTGFGGGVDVQIFWDGSHIKTRGTNGKGTFTWNGATVPESRYGPHTVTAVDEDSNMASTIFFVESNIEVDPSEDYVGTTVNVVCTGYGANEQIWIVWDPSLPTQEVVASGVTNDVGTFEGDFEVPEAVNGDHFVSGIDSEGNTATTTFTVDAYLLLVPSSGYAGDAVIAYGTGFSETKAVSLKWDNASLTTIPETVQTNSMGTFLAVFYVPYATHGSHIVEATDENGITALASYSVASRIVLNPDTGLANSSSSAVCAGFAGDKSIDIIWDPGLPTEQILSSGPTNSTGIYVATVTIPSATNGTHIVRAIDADGNTATTLYWVGPRIVLAPNFGYVATQTVINGTSFGANKTVTIEWEGNTIGTTNTDENGSFSYTLTIPYAINGLHQVTAVDSVDNTAYAYYAVLAHITVSENSGYVGDVITVTGTGFAGNSIVSVYWDGANTQRSEVSDSIGSVSLTFIVPESVQGVHNIQCIDGDGNPSNAVQFTVNPKIELSKESGYVGDVITVVGTGFAGNSPVTLTWDGVSQYAVETSNARGSVSITYTILSSYVGVHKISAYDSMLNAPSEKNFTIVPPEIPILISPANGTFTNVNQPTFTWSVAEGATAYSLQYSEDGTFSSGVTTINGILDAAYTLTASLSDGVWHWRVQAYDAYPNPGGYSDAYSVVIDTTSPTSRITPLAQYQNSTAFNIAYTSSDTLSGVVFVELYYSYSGGTFVKYGEYIAQNGTVPFNAPLGDGQYSFYTVAVDKAGNTQQVSAPQTQTIVDTTEPTSFVNTLPQYVTQRTFNVTYTESDPGSGVAYVVLFYSADDGNTWNRYGQFTANPITFTAQFDGKYMFFTVAVDNAGNVQSISVAQAETIVDGTSPRVLPQHIVENGEHVAGAYKFVLGIKDEVGVSNVIVSVDGSIVQEIFVNPQTGLYEFLLDTTMLLDGEHNIIFNITDNGNHVTTMERVFVVDNTPPAIMSFAPGPDEVQSGKVSISALINEVSDVSAVYISTDGGEWHAMTYNSDESKVYYEWSTEARDNGVHRISIKVVDSLGNSQVSDYTIRVDNPNYTPLLFFTVFIVGVALIYVGIRASRKAEARPLKSPKKPTKLHSSETRKVKR